jgi:hypothetical protein
MNIIWNGICVLVVEKMIGNVKEWLRIEFIVNNNVYGVYLVIWYNNSRCKCI